MQLNEGNGRFDTKPERKRVSFWSPLDDPGHADVKRPTQREGPTTFQGSNAYQIAINLPPARSAPLHPSRARSSRAILQTAPARSACTHDTTNN